MGHVIAIGLILLVIVGLISTVRRPAEFCWYFTDQTGCREYHRERSLYEKATLIEGVSFASSRRWLKHKLEWLETDGQIIKATKVPPATLSSAGARGITILVHGFRATDDTVSSYFEELIAFLKRRNPEYGVIVYDWPSVARAYETLSDFERNMFKQVLDPGGSRGTVFSSSNNPRAPNKDERSESSYFYIWETTEYQRDQNNARTIGADGLAALITGIAERIPDAKINLICHSMGCLVIEQALRKNPNISTSLKNIVWLAPDVPANLFDDRPFREAVAKLGMLAIFYSRDDEALWLPSRIANGGPRLGAVGSQSKNAMPSNVRIHDETRSINDALRSMPGLRGQGVHGAFLRSDAPIPSAVMKMLFDDEVSRN